MLTKEQVLESIRNMPEDRFEHIDILLERLLILEKIQKGENDILEDRTFTMEEARQKISDKKFTKNQ